MTAQPRPIAPPGAVPAPLDALTRLQREIERVLAALLRLERSQ